MKIKILIISFILTLIYGKTIGYAENFVITDAKVLHESNIINVWGKSDPEKRIMLVAIGPHSKDEIISANAVISNPDSVIGMSQAISDKNGDYHAQIIIKDGLGEGYCTVIGGIENDNNTKSMVRYYINESLAAQIINDAKAVTLVNVDEFYQNYGEKLGFENVSGDILNKTEAAFVECKIRTAFNGLNSIVDIQNAWDASYALARVSVSDEQNIKALLESYAEYFGINSISVPKTIITKFIKAVFDNRQIIVSWQKYDENFAGLKALATVNSAQRSELKDVLEANQTALGITLNNYYKANYETINMSLSNKDFKSVSEFKFAFDAAIVPKQESNTYPGSSGGGNGSGGAVSMNGAIPSLKIDNVSENNKFTDIDSVTWATEAINYLNENNIMNGVGNGLFEPNREITREEFTKIIVLAIGLDVGEHKISFKDVSESQWYYPYVAAAYKNGLVNGYSTDIFGVNNKITRLEMVYMVDRALTNRGIEPIVIEERKNAQFVDCFVPEAIRLYKSGIINGVGNDEFAPDMHATRAQAAKIIYEFIITYML